ncbi:GNAT family N-acetyltransferase [Falsiroseomonas oryziterrae]|uniref:GNAT family N-acetyltransferase n=1 Tax=Falsiroseomonas oryziterrae TaxID=2911368 RepID=UPI001F2BAC76|nr:N-acetyltransferase [Roseomonas sp. NPKOSM-4]
MQIRPARPADGSRLATLFADIAAGTAFIPFDPDHAADAAQRLSGASAGHRALLLAETAEGLLGFVDVQRIAPSPALRDGALLEVGVLSRARRAGVGSALIEAAESWARREGMTRMTLFVVASNWRAASLYLRRGYRFEGLRRAGYRMPEGMEDEYVMGKAL